MVRLGEDVEADRVCGRRDRRLAAERGGHEARDGAVVRGGEALAVEEHAGAEQPRLAGERRGGVVARLEDGRARVVSVVVSEKSAASRRPSALLPLHRVDDEDLHACAQVLSSPLFTWICEAFSGYQTCIPTVTPTDRYH